MNLRKKRIFRSILISIVMIILSATPALATVTGILGGDPEPNGGELSDMGNSILGYVVWFGWAIAVGVILVIAIRYMMASANEKADLKNGSIRYIVGVLLLATLITVFNGIMGIFSESEGEAGGTNQTTQGGGTQHSGGGSSTGNNSGGGNKADTKKTKVTAPTLTGDSTYNGKVQKAPLGNIDSSKVNISYYEADGKTPSTNELTNVGEKKIIKLTLKDPEKYSWGDGSTGEKKLTWEIRPMALKVEWQDTDSFEYDGTDKVPKVKNTRISGVNGEVIELAVEGGRTQVGTYTAKAVMSNETKSKDYSKNYVLDNATKNFTITNNG